MMYTALWPRTAKNTDYSTGPLARPFARSLAPLSRGKEVFCMKWTRRLHTNSTHCALFLILDTLPPFLLIVWSSCSASAPIPRGSHQRDFWRAVAAASDSAADGQVAAPTPSPPPLPHSSDFVSIPRSSRHFLDLWQWPRTVFPRFSQEINTTVWHYVDHASNERNLFTSDIFLCVFFPRSFDFSILNMDTKMTESAKKK